MKTNYYDIKQIKPNKVMKFKLNPRNSGRNYAKRKRGKRWSKDLFLFIQVANIMIKIIKPVHVMVGVAIY